MPWVTDLLQEANCCLRAASDQLLLVLSRRKGGREGEAGGGREGEAGGAGRGRGGEGGWDTKPVKLTRADSSGKGELHF